jgi:hypothetical protein
MSGGIAVSGGQGIIIDDDDDDALALPLPKPLEAASEKAGTSSFAWAWACTAEAAATTAAGRMGGGSGTWVRPKAIEEASGLRVKLNAPPPALATLMRPLGGVGGAGECDSRVGDGVLSRVRLAGRSTGDSRSLSDDDDDEAGEAGERAVTTSSSSLVSFFRVGLRTRVLTSRSGQSNASMALILSPGAASLPPCCV